MKVFLAGGEKGSHRNLLLSNNVNRIAVNITHLAIPKTKEFHVPTVYNGAEVLVYTSEGDEDINRYGEFVRNHAEELTYVIGRPDFDGEWLGDKHIPTWADGEDLERLAWLCQRYGRVAISDKAINAKTLPRIRSLAARWNAKLYGITSKPEVIEALPWEAVIVGSWTSAIRYGETQVWDGHGLRRYPAQQKESARRRHRSDIVRLGVDFDAVMEDDVTAVGTLAIISWKEWEASTFRAYDPSTADDEEEFGSSEEGDIVAIEGETHTGVIADSSGPGIAIEPIKRRHENDRLLLPVVGIENIMSMGSKSMSDEGESIEIDPHETSVIRYNSSPLRQCDSCYLASRCPAFQEHSECGYRLPIEIRTKDQLQAMLTALIEMQASRVLFARFAEELEGQGLDPALSAEMDRLFSLVDRFKNISDSRDLMRIEVEARGSSGVLSRLFGQKAGDISRQLPGGGMDSSQTDRFVQDIIDIEEG
jgi:hypothetical protein